MHSSSGGNRFMYTSGNTFIKKIKPFVCKYISMPPEYIKKDCKTSCFMICLPSVIDELEPFHQELHQTFTLRGSVVQHKQGILCYYGCYDIK